jgi:CheY-like chemotaxis protein/TolA-binding protein
MQSQQIEGQRAQTILVVDSDESTRRILDLSLRHAGFAVRVASNAEEGGKRLADRPDLVIVAADDPAGLDFCRRAKQADALAPAVVLMLDPGVESKRRGLEAGADDFVARPIYVQEVVARSRALLQRRDRERLELSAHDNERFVSAIEDVPLVDLLRAIAANQKSGVAIVVGSEGARGEIYFRQGRVVDAEVGRLSGREAVYRLFCWPTGTLAVEWKSIRRKDTVEMAPHDLLMEALRRVDEWRRLLAGVPPLDTIFEVDYRLLAERLADIPDEVNRILRLFDGVRTFLQVIDDCGLPDLDAVAAVGKLYRERIVHDVRIPQDEDETVGADMEGWLSEAAGPFRSPPRQERDLFGAGPDRGVGVHSRRTAPIEPLGDGAREALDDDMRVRFTDRLQAEGTAGAPDSASDGIPEVPLEALMESAPTGNGTRPATLPGMGTSKSTAPGMATAATEPSRPAITIPVTDATTAPVVLPPVPDDISPTSTLQGRAASSVPPPPPPPAASLLPPLPEATLLPPAVPPPPPPPAVSPLERPYGWSSSEGPGRSASGEILVVRKTPPIPLGTAEIPRVHVREDSGKAYVRKTTVTPPGSARALDEPPPIALGKTEESGRTSAAKPGEAIPVPQPREKSNRKVIKVDDGRDDAFSKSMAEDELGMSSGRKKALVIAGISAAAVIVIFAVVKLTRHKPPAVEDLQAQQQAPAAAPEQPPAPVIVPITGTGTETAAPPAGATPPAAKTLDTASMAGRNKPPLAPIGATREELDERGADPRMARERAPEARPLMYVCRMAFDQKRMRDAEPACIAARDANPESAEAHRLLAHAQFNRNKRHEALASAERAVKIDPKLADMYVIIGGVHQEDGDADEARRAYQRYLELEPKGSYAADLRAIIGRLPAKL